jgi:hypothetical protein
MIQFSFTADKIWTRDIIHTQLPITDRAEKLVHNTWNMLVQKKH